MSGRLKREIRGKERHGFAWVVPCYGGWAGPLWFIEVVTPPVWSVLGRAVFNSRREAREAIKALGEKGNQLDAPVRVSIAMKLSSAQRKRMRG